MKSLVKFLDDAVSYPCLMESSHGRIVLFSEKGVGVVVGFRDGTEATTTLSTPVGHFANNWATPDFTLFSGEVTLGN